MSSRTADLLDYVWLGLSAIYGLKFTSAFGEDPRGPSARQWAAELGGMSRAQIDAGLEACRKACGEEWPTLQAFRDRCLGIPPLAVVEHELRGDLEDASPFTLKVRSYLPLGLYIGAHGMKQERMRKEAYALAHAAVMRGEELPRKLAKLTAEKDKPVVPKRTPIEMEAFLARQRDTLRDTLQ